MGILTSKPEASFGKHIIDSLVTEGGYRYLSPEQLRDSFDKERAIDKDRLFEFLLKANPGDKYQKVLKDPNHQESILQKLYETIRKDGVAKVLTKGLFYQGCDFILFFHSLEKRAKELEQFAQNIFAVSNEVLYDGNPHRDGNNRLDLVIFINGLPIFTLELKTLNSLVSYRTAEVQYKNSRNPGAAILNFKCCVAHFAVDENYITFTTELKKGETRFLPFNKGKEDGGKGNPAVMNGYATEYLWREIFSKEDLTRILVNFVYLKGSKDKTKGKQAINKEVLIFPRYHQYRAVKNLVKRVEQDGVGKRYLIQHSAGSGKSNSISWLAFILASLKVSALETKAKEKLKQRLDRYFLQKNLELRAGFNRDTRAVFDSVIIVTDRVNLTNQISSYLRILGQPAYYSSPRNSKELRKAIESGKKIISTTIQKFPNIVNSIKDKLYSKNFAVIIDEAHSSQGKDLSAALNLVLGGQKLAEDGSYQERLNEYGEARKMPENITFFAFTATPKAETLELFGNKVFDSYTMKQAIEEEYILDVLKNYTTYRNYYQIVRKTDPNHTSPEQLEVSFDYDDDLLFDKEKAQADINRHVEDSDEVVQLKTQEIVNYFSSHTIKKIGGKAKAMVVTPTIRSCYKFYQCIKKELEKRYHNKVKCLIAFSGEYEIAAGKTVTEADLNGFREDHLPREFKKDEYRILIVADKYQTGYDEPLLHTMFVTEFSECGSPFLYKTLIIGFIN